MMSTMSNSFLLALTLALAVSTVNCQDGYYAGGIAGLGVFVTIVIFAIPIIVIALIAWCLTRVMRSRRSVGIIRVIPPTTTMIQVPQPITAPSMHFSLNVGGHQQQAQPSQYHVRLPQESSNQQQQQFQQPNQQNYGHQQPMQQQNWTQSGHSMQNLLPQASNFDLFGSQSAVNQGYQPEAPPAYEYEDKKEVPRY